VLSPLGLLSVNRDQFLGLLGTRNLRRIEDKGPISERHLVPHNCLMYPNTLSLISCVNPQKLLFSLVLVFLPLAPAVRLSTLMLSSYLCPLFPAPALPGRPPGERPSLCVCSPSGRLLAYSCFGLSGCFDTRLLSIGERSPLGSSMVLSTILYPLYNRCTSFPRLIVNILCNLYVVFDRTPDLNGGISRESEHRLQE